MPVETLTIIPFGLLFLLGFLVQSSPKSSPRPKTSLVASGARQTHTQCRTALDARKIAQKANQSVLELSLEHIQHVASCGAFQTTIKHATPYLIGALRRRKFIVSTDGDGMAIVAWYPN